VYVQVHNRGVTPADGVRVMLLLANASAGLPALPAGYDTNVRNGLTITTPDWKTVGMVTLNDVRVGFPKVAAFNLPSSMLPLPANLAGNNHHCVLALLHHANDQFTNTQTIVDVVSRDDRKAAHKNLTVVQFTGTVPPAMPIVIPFRINNGAEERLLTHLRIDLGKYRDRVRILTPHLAVQSEDAFVGLRRTELDGGLKKWAKLQREAFASSQRRKQRWDAQWSKERLSEIGNAIDGGDVLEASGDGTVEIRGILLEGGAHHTLFLAFDRPAKDAKPTSYPIEITQLDGKTDELLGGLSARVEVVTAPDR